MASFQTEDDPIPLFSPSQLPSQEKVLRSIFSPNVSPHATKFEEKKTATSSAEPIKADSPTLSNPANIDIPIRRRPRCQGEMHASPRSKNQGVHKGYEVSSSSPATEHFISKESALRSTKKKPRQEDSRRPAAPSTQFFSPLPQVVSSEGAVLRGQKDDLNEQFYSPDTNASAHSRFETPFSSISPLSHGSSVSFKTLPIDMLSFDFVKNCRSEEELEEIVTTLASGSPRNYPSLLRSAKKRLNAIRQPDDVTKRLSLGRTYGEDLQDQNDTNEDNFHSPASDLDRNRLGFHESLTYTPNSSQWTTEDNRDVDIHISEGEVNPGAAVSSAVQESTLVMSLSSSLFENMDIGDDDSGVEECKIEPIFIPEKNEPAKSEIPTPANGNTKVSFDPAPGQKLLQNKAQNKLTSHGPDSSRRKAEVEAEYQDVIKEEDRIKAELSEQVRKLTVKVRDLEYSGKLDNRVLLQKIKSIEESKEKAEQDIALLEETVASSSTKMIESETELSQMRKEVLELHERLRVEKAAAKKQLCESQALEEELRLKVTSLSEQLVRTQQASHHARQSDEEKMRNYFEEKVARERASVDTLNHSLQEARSNLEDVKSERDSIINAIQCAMGVGGSNSKPMTIQERTELVSGITTRLASSKAASKALAQSLASSENDRRAAIAARKNALGHLTEANASNRRLQRENELLTKQIQELMDELTSSRAYIDNLLSSKRENNRAEQQTREKDYQETIRKLKSQLRQGESTISLALYRTAVTEARSRAAECEKNRREIAELTSKVNSLEQERKEKKQSSQVVAPIRSRHAKLEAMRLKLERRDARNISPSSSEENVSPRTPLSEKMNNPAPKHFAKKSDTQASKIAILSPSPESAIKSFDRVTLVRAAGGRAGLCAKLRQMRRSSFSSQKGNGKRLQN